MTSPFAGGSSTYPVFFVMSIESGPATVLATGESADFAALVARLVFGKPLRVVVHQATMFTTAIHERSFKARQQMRLIRLLLPLAHGIAAVSEGVAADLRAQAPRAALKISTIYDPVVSEDIGEQAELAVEHPWFVDGGAPVVLAVGRLVELKGHPTLLRAFAEVVRSRPARLVILGQGVERESLLELAECLGVSDRFDLPGFDVNPFRYMSRASVFVLSSRYEGFPNVLAQAMACGAPVVSTDCRSGPSEMLEGGRWGRLAPVGDWRAMARAIEDTLDDPMPAEELKARASVYSVEASVERYFGKFSVGQLVSWSVGRLVSGSVGGAWYAGGRGWGGRVRRLHPHPNLPPSRGKEPG